MRPPVPTTVISGALGVGKTTAIRAMLAHRPSNERWAVLVNEFGEIGIDGAVLDGTSGLEVREIAGGCICCTANVPLRVALVKLLREVSPDRLFIEPTGLAHPATVVDALRANGVRDHVERRATIGLVDPRRYLAHKDDPLFSDQVLSADLLVGNFADRMPEEVLERFVREAKAAYPPHMDVITTTHGAVPATWLDRAPAPRAPSFHVVAQTEAHAFEVGFVWPASRIAKLDELQQLLGALVRPGPLLPDGVLRLKGLFRTERGVLLVQATDEEMRFEPIGWRRDSRVAVLTSKEADPVPLLAAFDEVLREVTAAEAAFF